MPLQTEIIDTIDLGSLACAVLVLEQGSFRKAAEALQVRPSVVSRRVRGLEDHIGVSIFNRTARGIQATIAGGRILKQARGILSDVAALRGVAAKNGTGTEGQLRFGVVASIASSFARHLLNHVQFETHSWSAWPGDGRFPYDSFPERLRFDWCYELIMNAGARRWRICAAWP